MKTKEKQIKEMLRFIKEANNIAYEKSKNSNDTFGEVNTDFAVAEHLCEAGYRKQSDVVKEIFEDFEREMSSYWGNIQCMKDYVISKAAFAELKKKYTEDARKTSDERKANIRNGRGIKS